MRTRALAVSLAAAAGLLAGPGSAQALTVAHIEGHVLGVPVSCDLAVPAPPSIYDPLGESGAYPNCAVGSAVDCHDTTVWNVWSHGCVLAAGPAVGGCTSDGVSYGPSGHESEEVCAASVLLGSGQGLSISCERYSFHEGVTHYWTVDGRSCTGSLAAAGKSVELACTRRETLSAGGGGSSTTATARCGVPTLGAECTQQAFDNGYSGESQDNQMCTVPPVGTLTCTYKSGYYSEPPESENPNRDECVLVVDPPVGPTCTVALLHVFTDPPVPAIDPNRTGCVV